CYFICRSCGRDDSCHFTYWMCGLVPYSGSDSNSPDEMSSPKHISLLPAILPFLCTDSSKAPDSSDGPPSQDP
ncbi:hypothetical protein Tco_0557572, partial [Tanacetum coccineum]